MKKLIVAMAIWAAPATAQDLSPPLGNLFAPCRVGLGALYQLEIEGDQASLITMAIGSAIRYYLVGLAHGRYGAADVDGYAKVYYHFLAKCDEDDTLRIVEIGSGM